MGPNHGDDVPQVTLEANSVWSSAGSYPLEGGYLYVNVVQNPTMVFQYSVSPSGDPVFTEVAQSQEDSAYILGVGHGTTTSLNGKEGTGLYWVTDIRGYNLRVYKAVPENGYLVPVKFLNIAEQMKFSRPVFGDGRAYLTTFTGQVVCVGSPVNLPLNCSGSYDFGSLNLGNASVAQKITCTANIGVQVNAISISSVNFNISGLPSLPVTLTAGQTISFQGVFDPTQVGPLSDDVVLNTTNGVASYSTKTDVSLSGIGISQMALLNVIPNTVSFSEIVTGQNPNGVSSSFIIQNTGVGPLTVSNYQFSSQSETGPWLPIQMGSNQTEGPFTFMNLPSSVPGNSQVTVAVVFKPSSDNSYGVFLQVNSNGGSKVVDIIGTSGGYPTALLQFQSVDGNSWVNYSSASNFTFGNVTEQQTKYLNMRLSNIGNASDGILDITVSKPPTGVGLIEAANGVSLGEGTEIAPGSSQNASLFCSVPKAQVNTDSYSATAQWTLNTGDPTFNKTFIQFSCEAIAEQQGPLFPNGSAIYRYIGCYQDNTPNRQLSAQPYSSSNNTNGLCQTTCQQTGDYIFSGMCPLYFHYYYPQC